MPARGVVIGGMSLNVTEDGDTLVAPAGPGAGAVNASLTGAPGTMADDTLAGAASIVSQRNASLAVTEGADTSSAAAQITSPRNASLAATEALDTTSSAAHISAFPVINGAAAPTEGADTLASAGSPGALVTRNGALSGTEAGDTLAAAAGPLAAAVSASLTPGTEASDTLVSLTQTDNVINGVAIGAIGTGTLTNFKLIAGDDFIGPVKYWDVHTSPTSRMYAGFHFNGNRGQQEGASTALHFSMDPHWRGPRSAVPAGINVDPTSVSNSVLTVTLKKPDDATLIANLPTTYLASIGNTGGKPAIQTAEIRTGPYFHYSGKGDWCIEAVYEVDAGQAVGYWGGPWETGTAFWPNFGEYDVGETTTNITTGVKTYDTGYHISDVDGGPDVSTVPLTLVDIPNDRPIWVRAIKTATKIEQWDDVAVQGTLALRNTYSNAARVARCRGAHQFRVSGFCDLAWHGGTFNPAQWPKTFKYHWWRVWGPSGGRDWVAPIDLGTTQVAANGSWSWVMPSPTAMYGAVPDYEEVIYTADGMDSPGVAGRNLTAVQTTSVTPPIIVRLLGGQSYNAATRTWSGTIPSGEGGRIGFQCMGSFDTGGACRMAYKWFEVAPNVQATLFPNQNMTPGTPITPIVIAYADFHSGNLGPHVYTVTFSAGGAGLTITGSGTGTVTISGTPTGALDAVVNIDCTNAKGQTTTVSRILDNTLSVLVGGIAIGAAGTGVLAGFKFLYGDDFDTMPTFYSNINRSGKYMTVGGTMGGAYRSNQPAGNGRNLTVADNSIYMEPEYRGVRQEFPTSPGFQPFTQAGSVLTITARPVVTADKQYLPFNWTGSVKGGSQSGGDANHQPLAITGQICSAPQMIVCNGGDWASEIYLKFSTGPANGYWFAHWTACQNWPEFGEFDIIETYNSNAGPRTLGEVGINENDTANLRQIVPGFPYVAFPDRFCRVLFIKKGSSMTMYDDIATAGSLVQRGTISDAWIGSVQGDQMIRVGDLVIEAYNAWGGPFTAAQWPKNVQIDWWRFWGPAGAPDWQPPTVFADINVSAGGSWAFTFPNQTACYGRTVTSEYYARIHTQQWTPGWADYITSSFVPAGMTFNQSTRTCSGTIPLTEGGRVGFAMIGLVSSGGCASVAIQYWNVAPVAEPTLFANQTVANGVPVSIPIAFKDFHSGDLGPHTYVVTQTSGPTGLTVTYGSPAWTATIAGTPTTNGAIVFSIACTNGIGQTTTVSRTLTVATVAATMTMDLVNNVYVFGGSTYNTWAAAQASAHWTFARALKAYYITSTGAVTEWGTGQFRTGGGGGRIEPARANMCRLSMTMDITGAVQSYGAGLTSVPNNQTDPMGTSTADTHTVLATAAQHYIGQNATIGGNNYTSGTSYEHVVFVKKGTQRYIQIVPPSGILSTGGYMNCDFDTGASSIGGTGLTSGTFRPLANGWYMGSVTFVATATAANGLVQVAAILDMSATRNPSWTPGATSTFYTWQCHSSAIETGRVVPTLPVDNPSNNGSTAATARPADDLGIVLPAGTWNIRVTFMDNTTQLFTGVSGTYHLPASSLNQFDIKTIVME